MEQVAETTKETLLSIEHVTLSFRGETGLVRAVSDVSLTVQKGEILALVGESGCGKTALCRAVMMLHNQHAVLEKGRILLCGREVSAMEEKALEQVRGRYAGMVFQDPLSSLDPTMAIGKQVMEPMVLHRPELGRKEAKAAVIQLLEQVGISDAAARFNQRPHHFSGGMRQRVAIAIALAAGPRLLIADEPTTALDVETQDRIMVLLRRLCEEKDLGMILVTHDLGLTEHVADRVAVMQNGIIVEEGKTEDIFAAPQHPYTKQLLGYARYGKAGSHYHGRTEEETSSPDSRGPVLEIQNLHKSFPIGKKQAHPVLKDFCLTVYPGEIVGITGPSGCGKSTMARCIMGILRPDGGEIRLAAGCKAQMIFQDSASALNPRMTIFDIIAEPLVIKKQTGTKEELAEKVYRLMDETGLARDLAERHPYDVSGGQRQRAAIARALITDPDLLIADEPIASLDVSMQAQIIHLLKDLQEKRNLTMVLISHDLPMAIHISDRIIQMG